MRQNIAKVWISIGPITRLELVFHPHEGCVLTG